MRHSTKRIKQADTHEGPADAGSDKVLRKELLALLQGGNAHMSFDEVIEDFPMEHINSKARHVPYSAWHFMEHMRIAQWDILEFIRNPKHISPDYPAGYRPHPAKKADEAQWNRTVEGFLSDRKALEDMVRDEQLDLFAPVPHAGQYTIFREIVLACDHNAYHIAEIALLRQVLDLWPAGNQYLTGTEG